MSILERCVLLEVADGHEHGPGCGHQRVQHDDHWDFLVGPWCRAVPFLAYRLKFSVRLGRAGRVAQG